MNDVYLILYFEHTDELHSFLANKSEYEMFKNSFDNSEANEVFVKLLEKYNNELPYESFYQAPGDYDWKLNNINILGTYFFIHE